MKSRRQLVTALAVWVVLLLLPAFSPARDAEGKSDPPRIPDARQIGGVPPPEAVVCGPNGVYLLLRAHGIDVDPKIISDLTPKHWEGLSLTEVRDALNAKGLRVEIRRCDAADLGKCFPCPAIALERGAAANGHYFVVLSISGDKVHVMDATSGKTMVLSPQALINYGDGYFIVPTGGYPAGTLMLATVLIILLVIPLCYLHVGKTLSGALKMLPCGLRLRIGHCMRSLSLLVAAVLLPFPAEARGTSSAVTEAVAESALRSSSPSSLRVWRKPANDGLNCLYLQLRLMGYTGNYEDIAHHAEKRGGLHTLKAMSELGADLGFRTTAVKLTFAELRAMKSPVIVLVEPDGIGTGRLCLNPPNVRRMFGSAKRTMRLQAGGC